MSILLNMHDFTLFSGESGDIYQADLLIFPFANVDMDECVCPVCDGLLAPDHDLPGHAGMLAGTRWAFTGNEARYFFLYAEQEYLKGLKKGVYIETFPLLFEQTVPAEFCRHEDAVTCYIAGFSVGVACMLSLHLTAVEAARQGDGLSAHITNGN